MYYVNHHNVVTRNTANPMDQVVSYEECLYECRDIKAVLVPSYHKVPDNPDVHHVNFDAGVWLFGAINSEEPIFITTGRVYVMNDRGTTIATYDVDSIVERWNKTRQDRLARGIPLAA